jgi:hypothetical protein
MDMSFTGIINYFEDISAVFPHLKLPDVIISEKC